MNDSLKTIYKATLDTKPVPASRPRVTKRGTFYAEPYNSHKKMLKDYISVTHRGKPSIEPLKLFCVFVFEKPKSWTKKKATETFFHTVKPDADNLVKSIKDAMNGIVYKDDAQVVDLAVIKLYGDTESIRVKVCEIKNNNYFEISFNLIQ